MASLSVKNLFDREYFVGSSKADGRSVFLGLGFKY
jgi:outer membrane receptor protein involved in Fe transport